MHQEIDAVIMGRIKDALQPLEHNWSIDKYCQDLTARAALPAEAAAAADAAALAPTPTPTNGTDTGTGKSTLVGLGVLCAVLFLAVLVVGTLVPVNNDIDKTESE